MTPPRPRILERVAAGEPDAVRACVAEYGGLVWSLALRLSRRREDAEDAVQEIFVELWRHAKRFDPALATEPTFIAMIARRRLYDRLRRAERVPEPIDQAELERLCQVDGAGRAEARGEAQMAARAVARLDPADRQVLVLATHYGMSHAEIARQLEMPLGTVKTRARRALLQVRGWLQAGDAGPEVAQ